MKAGKSGMPGFIAASAVSFRLYRVNYAGAVTRSEKAETEQPCSLSSKTVEAVVPSAVVPEHRVEDDQELAHSCCHGHFMKFPGLS